jgi:hypothetical protein
MSSADVSEVLFADLLRHVEEAKTIDNLAATININDLGRSSRSQIGSAKKGVR